MKKYVGILTVVLLLASAAVAAAEEVTLTVWGWGETVTGLQAAFEIWKKDHPNVKLETAVYDQGDVQDMLAISLMTGVGAPDICPVEQARVAQFAALGGLEDLTDIVAGKEDEFASFALANSQYNGRYYAVPWDIGPVGFFYRVDIFEEAGVEAPATWEDIIEAGKAITQDLDGDGFKDRYLLNLEVNDVFQFFMFLRARNLLVFDAEGNFVLDNEDAKEVFTFFTELATVHDIAVLEPYWTPAWWNSIKEGRLAAIPIAVWFAGLLKDQAPELEGLWSVAPWPAFEGQVGSTNWGGSTLVVPSQSKYAELAKDFIEFALTTKEGQLAIYEASNLFPAYLPALESDVFA